MRRRRIEGWRGLVVALAAFNGPGCLGTQPLWNPELGRYSGKTLVTRNDAYVTERDERETRALRAGKLPTSERDGYAIPRGSQVKFPRLWRRHHGWSVVSLYYSTDDAIVEITHPDIAPTRAVVGTETLDALFEPQPSAGPQHPFSSQGRLQDLPLF